MAVKSFFGGEHGAQRRAGLLAMGLLLAQGGASAQGPAPAAPASPATPATGKAPDATAAQPVPARTLAPGIIDIAGDRQTKIEAWRSPGGAWVPRLEVLAHIPALAPEDVLMATFKKGRKKLGKPFACKPREMLPDYQRRHNTPKHRVDLAYFECKFPKEYEQTKPGNYEVELAYKRTLEGKQEPLGSLYLTTFNIKHGSLNKQQTLQDTLHDGPVGVAFVYESSAYTVDGYKSLPTIAESFVREALADQYTDSTFLNLKVRTKNDDGRGYRRYEAICFHEGQRIGTRAIASSHSDKFSHWTYAGKEKKKVSWTDRVFRLNNLRVRDIKKHGAPPNNGNWWYLDQHPGKYECKIVADGEIRGIARFEVQGGRVVPHKCTEDLNTPDHVAVVAFEDKSMSDLKVDKKQQKRIFYGPRTWSKSCPPRK